MDDGLFLAGDAPATDNPKILKGSDVAALLKARADVDTAELQAAQIIAQAHEDAERIRTEALEIGMRQSSEYLTESAARVARDLDALEPRLCAIVSDALRRVLDPIPVEEQIVAAVRCALKETDLSRGVTLIVAPSQLGNVQDRLRRFSPNEGVIEAIGDPMCALDSAILRTPYGDIELDLESQLTALSDGIEAVLIGGSD